MSYNQYIKSLEPKLTTFNRSKSNMDVMLVVGNIYKVTIEKPTNKKDRKNNGRIVEILGFTDSFWGDEIVRYLDNNRRGRLSVNCLLPHADIEHAMVAGSLR